MSTSELKMEQVDDQRDANGSMAGTCHPQLQNVQVNLQNSELWRSFHHLGTEMIITKTGRRMFPYLRLSVTGLEPHTRYFVLLEMSPASSSRYKYSGVEWQSVGSAEPHLPTQARLYIHPDSPAPGAHWTGQHILLNKVKLTNNSLDRSGNIVLNSMHKYQPRVHIVMASDILAIHWSPQVSFVFPETGFMAVTAYQNDRVTKLKIDNNPFAKGFRDTSVASRPMKRKAEPIKEPEKKIEADRGNLAQSSTPDDSGISSVGSPTPPVISSPNSGITDNVDNCFPALPFPWIISPELPQYLHHPIWPYPYFLPPPPPPSLYQSPYFPYLLPPFHPPSEPFLMDLSVKRDRQALSEK